MIAYFDSSSFVALLIEEKNSSLAKRVWRSARSIAATRLLFVEGAAALRRARMLDRIDEVTHARALRDLEEHWAAIDLVIDVEDSLMRSAASVASELGLRGYDAVHCAAAQSIASPETVAVAGDRRLLEAWQTLGLATAAV